MQIKLYTLKVALLPRILSGKVVYICIVGIDKCYVAILWKQCTSYAFAQMFSRVLDITWSLAEMDGWTSDASRILPSYVTQPIRLASVL